MSQCFCVANAKHCTCYAVRNGLGAYPSAACHEDVDDENHDGDEDSEYVPYEDGNASDADDGPDDYMPHEVEEIAMADCVQESQDAQSGALVHEDLTSRYLNRHALQCNVLTVKGVLSQLASSQVTLSVKTCYGC